MPVDNSGRRHGDNAALQMCGENAVRGRYRRQRRGRIGSRWGTGYSLPINLRSACTSTYAHTLLEFESKRLHDNTKGRFIERFGRVAAAGGVEAGVYWVAVDEPSKFVSLWDLWASGQITKKRSAVVRAVFHMQAKNDPEVIKNEILFWCQMDESGEKIVQSTEFVDPAALQALGPKLKAAKMATGE